ncbi:MAG: 3-phosphoshikimate 1-carboxyvinyltransferase [Eubacterium sp.]|nr:3-phosphoshikimate 1-carboxyvinyltransferase [Eubacterium sp.]
MVKEYNNQYKVNTFNKPVNIQVRVPGSKSITNRALLIAALSDGECVLRGCGMSDDSRVFIEALVSLGFDVQVDGCDVVIRGEGGSIPRKHGDVYVGSAGTAARFLTAMMGLSDGVYEVTSSDQMKTRPMRPLLEALELLGAAFTFHEQPYAFPFTVTGAACMADRSKTDSMKIVHDTDSERITHESWLTDSGKTDSESHGLTIPLNIDASSQFLSALLLCAPMIPSGFSIELTGKREALSYVKITEQMMSTFIISDQHNRITGIDKQKDDLFINPGENPSSGQPADGYNECEGHCKRMSDERSEEANRAWPEQSCIIGRRNNTIIVPSDVRYHARKYDIEPDVSAACYFYAMAAINGGSAHVRGVNRNNTQGDMQFLDVLEQMGCSVGYGSGDGPANSTFAVSESDGSGQEINHRNPVGDIIVSRDPSTQLHGIDVDMSDFSDQTMTLSVIAPFADSPTIIRGVGHIRNQESDRIHGIVTELTRLGIRCEEYPDGLKIYPIDNNEKASDETVIDTYNDHRMAMSFAVIGTRIPGVVIDNPDCSRKTFDAFFEILSGILEKG